MTSARGTEQRACYRVRKFCVFSHVQKRNPGIDAQMMRFAVFILQRAELRHSRSRDETKYS